MPTLAFPLVLRGEMIPLSGLFRGESTLSPFELHPRFCGQRAWKVDLDCVSSIYTVLVVKGLITLPPNFRSGDKTLELRVGSFLELEKGQTLT